MKLKNLLLTDAASCAVAGILLVLLPEFFADLFEIDTTLPFMEVGIFLIVFSVFVMAIAFKNPGQNNWTKLIIGLNIIWVLCSLVTVILLFSSISTLATIIILTVAGWVSLMAYLQSSALRMS